MKPNEKEDAEDAFDKMEKFDELKGKNERGLKMIDSTNIGEIYFDNFTMEQIVREMTNPITNVEIKTAIGNFSADPTIVYLLCSKTLPSRSKLDRQFKLKHSPKEELVEPIVHSCAFCDDQSDNKADLKENVKAHENSESYLCQHYAIQCKNKEALSHRIEVNHQDDHKFQWRYCPVKSKESRIIKH